jgi:hypothetical protein
METRGDVSGRARKWKGRDAEARTTLHLAAILRYRFIDEGVRLMYALKLLRFFGQLGALWYAQRAYNEWYNSAVYADGADPPHLSRMLYTFLGIDATFQLFTLVLLVTCSYTMGTLEGAHSPLLVIDDEFLSEFLTEYFVSTTAIFVLGRLFATFMRRKRYFALSTQGALAVRGYAATLAATSLVIGAVPFFLLFYSERENKWNTPR